MCCGSGLPCRAQGQHPACLLSEVTSVDGGRRREGEDQDYEPFPRDFLGLPPVLMPCEKDGPRLQPKGGEGGCLGKEWHWDLRGQVAVRSLLLP